MHLSPQPAGGSHLEVGVQRRLGRVNDEVAQREAKTLGVLVEDQRPGTLPAHADPLPSRPGRHRRPRVVAGRGETIPSALRLRTEERHDVHECHEGFTWSYHSALESCF